MDGGLGVIEMIRTGSSAPFCGSAMPRKKKETEGSNTPRLLQTKAVGLRIRIS